MGDFLLLFCGLLTISEFYFSLCGVTIPQFDGKYKKLDFLLVLILSKNN